MSTATLATPTIAALRATVDQPALLDALRHAERAIDPRTHLPILTGVLLEADRGALTVTGWNYHTAASSQIAAAGAIGGAVVPARRFRQMIAALPKDADVILTAGEHALTVEGGPVTYTLPLLPHAEYPALPTVGKRKVATVTGEQLRSLAWVLKAAGRDDTLPVLTGVHLARNTDTGTLDAATTDRYRLAVLASTVKVTEKALPDGKILVPARALADAVTVFGKSAKVTITLGDNGTRVHGTSDMLLWFTDGTRTFATRLLDGEFPKYRTLLPNLDSCDVLLTVEAQAMLSAVKRAAVACTRTMPVVLHLAGTGNVKFTTGLPGERTDSGSADVPIAGAVQTGTLPPPTDRQSGLAAGVVGYNPTYLQDGFSTFDGADQVTMHVQSATKPVVFTSDARPGFSYLLMPVRLAG